MPKVDTLSWKIIQRTDAHRHEADLPAEILTISPAFQHENMPLEVGMLLPTNIGPRQFLNGISQNTPISSRAVLGLFLNDPLLNIQSETTRLLKSGFKWITNLPSVEQQDLDFSQQLSDVGLDRQREIDLLAQFKSKGFKIAAVVADSAAVPAVVKINPEIIIVMPRISDFAAGFPSPRQRGKAAQNVFHATQDLGWSGILLGLGEQSEIGHERLWPDSIHGLLCRPQPTKAALT